MTSKSRGFTDGSFHQLLKDLLKWNKRDHFEALSAFDELVRKGCDPCFLLFKLVILANAPRDDTWLGLTGFADPRALTTVLKRLRYCADDLERLLAGAIGKALLQAPSDLGLPLALRTLAERFERTVRNVTPRKNLVSRTVRALIVRHVQRKTGRCFDELVASILSPALGPYCNAAQQNQWRRDNGDLIAIVRLT